MEVYRLTELWALLSRRDKRLGFAILIGTVFGSGLEIIGVGLLTPTILLIIDPTALINFDRANRAISASGLGAYVRSEYLAIAIVAFFLIKGLYFIGLAKVQTAFAFSVKADISRRMFEGYIARDYIFHLNNNSSHLLNNVVNETQELVAKVINQVVGLLTELVIVTAIVALLFAIAPVGALLMILTTGTCGVVFHIYTRKRLSALGYQRQHAQRERYQTAHEAFSGIAEIKLFSATENFSYRYRVINELTATYESRESLFSHLPRHVVEISAILGIVLVVLSMRYQQSAIVNALSTLGLFAAAAVRVMPSVNRILSAFQALRYSDSVLDLVNTELRQVPALAHVGREVRSDPTDVLQFERRIHITGLTYSYPGSHSFAIKDIAIEIEKGSCIGIIGESGAGKSTLVLVLLGLLRPQGGRISIDDGPWIPFEGLGGNIGYVPQSIFLMDGTIKENIAFGVPIHEIDAERMTNVVRLSKVSSFLESTVHGLDTVVGERGTRLSGGQRQRIGIARALYRNPHIIVFDEATSALDNETESVIIEEVTNLRQQGITVLMIAHRLSTLRECHQVYEVSKAGIQRTIIGDKSR